MRTLRTKSSADFLIAVLRQNSIRTENSATPCRGRCPIGVRHEHPELPIVDEMMKSLSMTLIKIQIPAIENLDEV